MKAFLTSTLALAFFCLLAASIAVGQGVPQTLNVQGKLTVPGGTPVADGSYSVLFSIYDVASGGTAIWQETRTVNVSDGLFSIILGESTPIPASVFNNTDRWLGMKVESDPEMTPRQRLTSVPYAMKSTGGAGDITEVIAGSGLTGGGTTGAVTLSVASEGITSTHIANSTITNSDIATGAAIAISKISGDVGVEFNDIGSIGDIGTSIQNIGSVSVNCPTSGYVVLCLSGYAVFFGENTGLHIGFGTTTGSFQYEVLMGHIDATTTLGRYEYAFSPVYVVPVAAGNQTFYALAQKPAVFSANKINLGGLHLVALFIPKRY